MSHLSSNLLRVCKELIDDNKAKCVNLVFKEVCLEILAHASHILSEEDFSTLVQYASERMMEKPIASIDVLERNEFQRSTA